MSQLQATSPHARCPSVRSAPGRSAAGLWCAAATTFILLPWLNPFTSGPTSPMLQWLLTCVAVAGLLLLGAALRWRVEGNGAASPWPFAIAWGWLLAGLLSSVFGLVQYLGASEVWAPWVNVNEVGHAFANLRQPNQFATLTNMALAALCWVVVSGTSHGTAKKAQWWPLAMAALLAAGNAASASRTGLLQLGLLLVLATVWGCWRHAAVRRVLLVAVGAYVVALGVLPVLIDHAPFSLGALARVQGDGRSCVGRMVLWSNVLHLIQQQPLTGWGWGGLDYAHYMAIYPGDPGERFCAILDNAHNLPLQLAVELGVPAALLLCGGAMWWVLRQKPWREVHATRQLAWAVIALVGLHSLLEYPLWYGPFLMAMGLCVVLLWRTAPAAGSARWPAVVLLVSGVLLASATAYAAWDYHRISQLYLPAEARDAAYRGDTAAKVGGTWLFRDQVRFAYVTTVPVTRANAKALYPMAEALLYFSPEPRVIEKLIESATMLGLDDVAAAHIRRYRAAFPQEYAAWSALNRLYADTQAAP